MAPAQFVTQCVTNWECVIKFKQRQHLPSGKPVAGLAGSHFLQTGVVARCSSYFKNFTNFVAKYLFIAQSKRTNFFAICETICNKNTTKYLMEDKMWVKLTCETVCYYFIYAFEHGRSAALHWICGWALGRIGVPCIVKALLIIH